MSFLKSLVGHEFVPPVQATQAPANLSITSFTPRMSGTGGNDVFFRLSLVFVMNGNEHEILNNFLKLKPLVLLGFKIENDYEFYLRLL